MFLLISDLIRGLSGGFVIIYTGVYTYIARKTSVKFRALRFAILEFFTFIGNYVITVNQSIVN